MSFSLSPQLIGLLPLDIYYPICIYAGGTPVSSFFQAGDLSFQFLHGMSKNSKMRITHSILTLSGPTWDANGTDLQGKQPPEVCL